MDIIWPCVSTLFLCLYSMLHLNLPAPDDSSSAQFLRRLRWVLLGILAPELPMLFAFAQLESARRSVQDMKALGHTGWTISHGFYADSGGFVLHAAGIRPFPVTAKQLAYLVECGHVQTPIITKSEISDKGKADHLAKGLACFQSGGLIVRLIGRAIHGLQITPIELATSGLVFCSLVTLSFWWHKPLNVQTPTAIFANCDIRSILCGAGSAVDREPFRDTPLDFAEPKIYWCSTRNGKMPRIVSKCAWRARPLTRIPNDRDFRPSGFRENLYLAIVVFVFANIHNLGWNLTFPTMAERLLWKINCVIMTLSLAVYGASEMVGFWQARYLISSMDLFGGYKMRKPWCAIFVFFGTLYFVSRICILLEATISLRDLPEAAFVEVPWTQFLPRL